MKDIATIFAIVSIPPSDTDTRFSTENSKLQIEKVRKFCRALQGSLRFDLKWSELF